MAFDDILDQVIALLKRQGRVSYGAMERHFDLDDAYLEDLPHAILAALGMPDAMHTGLTVIGDIGAGQSSSRALCAVYVIQPVGHVQPGEPSNLRGSR